MKRALPELKVNYSTKVNLILIISLIFFTIRLVHAGVLINHAYLGADGPNYINAFLSLIKDGLYSSNQQLLYWPAGYSIFVYCAYYLVPDNPLFAVSLLQNLFCTLGIVLFTKALASKIQNNYFALLLCLLLNISPMVFTLSLSIGYESMIISLYMIILGIYVKNDLSNKSALNLFRLFIIASCMATIVSFQPRFILSNFVIIYMFQFWRNNFNRFLAISVTILILSNLISPLALAIRNHEVHGVYIVSNNFAETLLIGAGDNASGAYNENPIGIPCKLDSSSITNRERSLTMCVLNWYATHPLKGLRLLVNKAHFYWTPWSGPFSKGTLTGNPWQKYAPGNLIQDETESKIFLVGSKIGSLLYFLGYIFLTLFGYRKLITQKSSLTILRLSHVSFVLILLNMLISMATIGDNRFRVPMLALLTFLQLTGLFYIADKWQHIGGKFKK